MAKVLIIDDDYTYAGMLIRQMAALGHQVRHSETWCDGHAAAASFEPDIVLLDVWLPDANGLHHIHDLKSRPGKPEVIAITGAGDEAAAELAIRAGAWDYWQKGKAVSGLVAAVGRMIEHRAYRANRRPWRTLDLRGLVAESPAMASCCERLAEATMSDVPVLIRGETGTGKERVAQAIHRNSARAKKMLVVVDCAALAEHLVESALFGHDKGAFTGANTDRIGLVRQAQEGTLFLDEVGELPLTMQKSFLRVLQEKRFRPVGSDRELESDFRLLAATHRDLAQMVEAGAFREDLYFRLRSMEIVLPPLRDRGRDAVVIAEDTVATVCQRLTLPGKALSSSFADALMRYPWSGNVRELCQAVECAVVAAGPETMLDPVHLPMQIRVHVARAAVKAELNQTVARPDNDGYPTLVATREATIAAYLVRLIQDTDGDMDKACRLADVSRSRLYELLRIHGVGRTLPKRATELRAVG
jgi:two-component system, NtrC family, response regulator